MKLLYLWLENYEDRMFNQSFNISNSYQIDFDIELNRLRISKNKYYIKNFYGNNILDITAIVGKNGVGKTTIARCLYETCDSVNPCPDDKGYGCNAAERILVYERGTLQGGEPSDIIIHYNLSAELDIDNPDGIKIEFEKTIQGEELNRADQNHDITTVYFTNAFEISNVLNNRNELNNQGFTEFSIEGVHKSLCNTPMLSLQRAFTKLKRHYGAAKADNDAAILDVINQYAQNMTTDFIAPYATAISNNFLIAKRYFPNAVEKLLPVMEGFELNVIGFGEYTRSENFF